MCRGAFRCLQMINCWRTGAFGSRIFGTPKQASLSSGASKPATYGRFKTNHLSLDYGFEAFCSCLSAVDPMGALVGFEPFSVFLDPVGALAGFEPVPRSRNR